MMLNLGKAALIAIPMAVASVNMFRSHPAYADFVDCAGLNPPMAQTSIMGRVVVGAIDTGPGSNKLSELQLEKLRVAIEQRLTELLVSMSGRIEAIPCNRHHPMRSDYTVNIVEGRYGQGVIIELWGESSQNEAIISYALIPALLPDYRESNIVKFIDMNYHFNRSSGIQSIFSQATDLRAYAMLSLGLRLLHDIQSGTLDNISASFGLMRVYKILCDARELIETASKSKAGQGMSPGDWQTLAKFALDESEYARRRAKSTGIRTPLADPPVDVTIESCIVAPSVAPPAVGLLRKP